MTDGEFNTYYQTGQGELRQPVRKSYAPRMKDEGVSRLLGRLPGTIQRKGLYLKALRHIVSDHFFDASEWRMSLKAAYAAIASQLTNLTRHPLIHD